MRIGLKLETNAMTPECQEALFVSYPIFEPLKIGHDARSFPFFRSEASGATINTLFFPHPDQRLNGVNPHFLLFWCSIMEKSAANKQVFCKRRVVFQTVFVADASCLWQQCVVIAKKVHHL